MDEVFFYREILIFSELIQCSLSKFGQYLDCEPFLWSMFTKTLTFSAAVILFLYGVYDILVVWFGFWCYNIYIWLHLVLLPHLDLLVSSGLWMLQRNYWRKEERRQRYLLYFDFISTTTLWVGKSFLMPNEIVASPRQCVRIC